MERTVDEVNSIILSTGVQTRLHIKGWQNCESDFYAVSSEFIVPILSSKAHNKNHRHRISVKLWERLLDSKHSVVLFQCSLHYLQIFFIFTCATSLRIIPSPRDCIVSHCRELLASNITFSVFHRYPSVLCKDINVLHFTSIRSSYFNLKHFLLPKICRESIFLKWL